MKETKPTPTSGRTIELSEHGAVLTIQVNPSFAVRLIDHIEHLESSKKAEGDNQILAGLLNAALGRALAKANKPVRLKKEEAKKLRREVAGRQDAIMFWQQLADDLRSEDGLGVTRTLITIEGKVNQHLAQIAELSAKMNQEGEKT